jgi:SPP1 gp7 family putative phage head morphogenesis protein
MLGAEHDAAFTVAKMMDTDLLATVQGKLQKALENGSTLADFKQQLIPELQASGWWGKKDVIDPETGKVVTAQLGSASRLETIFRSNLQSAYATGQWDSITRNAKVAPYLLYDAVDDHRTRPEHAARDGEVHAVNSPFWKTHYPPNGWNCRCGVIQLDKAEVEEMGLTISPAPKVTLRSWKNPRTGATLQVPEDVDPGWAHNPGLARQQKLAAAADEKAKALLTRAQRKAVKAARAQQAVIQAAYEKRVAQMEALDELAKPAKEAQAAIDQALAANAKYLAAEIKKLQAKKPGMDPVALLATAKEKALKAEQNSMLQTWKQAKKKGKAPSAKAAAYVDSLPESQQKALQAEIDEITGLQKAKDEIAALGALESPQGDDLLKQNALADLAADFPDDPKGLLAAIDDQVAAVKAANQAAAKAELQKIAAGEAAVQTKLKQKIFTQWSKNGTAGSYGDDVEGLVAALEAEAAKQQLKAEQSSVLSGYKQKVLAGKIPTPKQQQVFNGLDDAAKAKVMADIDAKKAQAAPAQEAPKAATATATINPDSLTQIGPQKGSNPGGLYQDTETGIQWYIKRPGSIDNARNEVLAAKLYQAAGIEVPDLELIEMNGATHIASRIIDGLASNRALLTGTKEVPGVADGFAMDAWLANWDVVGLSYDNLLVKAGRAIRVDTGGALRYPRPGRPERRRLRQDGPGAGQPARRHGGADQRRVWQPHARADGRQRPQGARLQRCGHRRPGRPLRAHEESRPHRPGGHAQGPPRRHRRGLPRGHGRPTGAGPGAHGARDPPRGREHQQRAQQRLRPAHGQGRRGGPASAGLAQGQPARRHGDQRLHEDPRRRGGAPAQGAWRRHPGARRLQRPQRQGPGRDQIDPLPHRPGRGPAHRRRAQEGRGRRRALPRGPARHGEGGRRRPAPRRAGQKPQGDLRALHAADHRERRHREAGVGRLAAHLQGQEDPRRQGAAGREGPARLAPGERPLHARRYPQGPPDRYRRRLPRQHPALRVGGGRRARGILPGSAGDPALKGRLQVTVPGNDPGAAARVFAVMDELGIDSSRATEADMELLYLRQIAYANKIDTQPAIKKALDAGDADQAARLISSEVGVDIRATGHYKPTGERQAFEHGRLQRFRPELLGHPDWPAFDKQYVLYHRFTNGDMVGTLERIIEGGGQMAPTTDKMRRGIPMGGMSPEEDLATGGANYFFTRINTKNTARKKAGITWKARMATRIDAITYDSDNFGRTTGDFVRQNRLHTLDSMKQASRRNGNETILKDSVSIFDNIDHITVDSESQRQRLISFMKKAGYDTWPGDGRALDDVIRTKG